MPKNKEDVNIREKVYDLVKRMSKEIGFPLRQEYSPEIIFSDKVSSRYIPYHGNMKGTIVVNYNELNSGDVLGEEIGHYIRDISRPKEKRPEYGKGIGSYFRKKINKPIEYKEIDSERHTDEFFGYLGRRILKKIARPNDYLEFRKDKGFPSKKEEMENLRKIREIRKIPGTYTKDKTKYSEDEIKRSRFEKNIAEGTRKNILYHHRPYEFASNIDLDEIKDFFKLFSLPDKEVRYRFFRNDPKYDLKKSLDDYNMGSNKQEIKQGKLERILKVTLAGLLAIFLFFASGKIMTVLTGNAILEHSESSNLGAVISGLALVAIAIVYLILNFRKK